MRTRVGDTTRVAGPPGGREEWSPGPAGDAPCSAEDASGSAGDESAASGGPPRRRRAVRAVLLCTGLLCLALVLAIGGGVTYLVIQRDAATSPETVPLEVDGISTVVPTGWSEVENPEFVSLRVLSALASPSEDQRVAIARETTGIRNAAGFCSVLLDSAKEQGLATVSAEVLDPLMVDGARAAHSRWVSYSEDRWHQGDAYCMADAESVVVLLAEGSSPDGAGPAPVAEVMLDTWTWVR